MRVALLGLSIVAALSWSPQAQACEPYPCLPGALLPAGGTIPANVEALRWHVAGQVSASEAKKMLELVNGKTPVPFSLEAEDPETFRVVLGRPLEEGATYTFTAKNACAQIGPKEHVSTFTVGPAAPMPDMLGSVTLLAPGKGSLQIGTSVGSCSVEEEAVWADVQVKLSDEAKPWAAMIDYQATTDAKPWEFSDTISRLPDRGSSLIGHGKERVYARCAADSGAFEGAGEGTHVVTLLGTVYGQPAPLKAEAISLVLDCDKGASVVSEAPASDVTEESSPSPTSSDPPPGASHESPGAHAQAGGCSTSGTPHGMLALVGLVMLCRRKRSGGEIRR